MNLVVIGAQWGDEGKGKIVDYLADKADNVIRFSGGANAGHTIVTNGQTYKLHLVPSGIVYSDKKVLLGSAMVIDPEGLFIELDKLVSQGVKWEGRVFISDRAHLVLPSYKALDIEMDKKRKNPIGTTGRGIGVAYAQKANRDGFRLCDIYDDTYYSRLVPEDKVFIDRFKEMMKPMVINAAYWMDDKKDESNLFEGAQGVLLDLDGGTYPFVSSGFSCSAGAAIGGSVGPRKLDNVMGVFKAYQTRVGNGPFPTGFSTNNDGDLENMIREIGNEYGVTTGRARSCGYLDLPALRYTSMINSMDSLVLTHLDVYDDMDEVKACIAYDIDGKRVEEFPSSATDLANAKPITKTFKGWKTPITKCKSFEELPKEAQEYINFIEEYTKTAVSIISVGPDRDQTFNRRNPWTKF